MSYPTQPPPPGGPWQVGPATTVPPPTPKKKHPVLKVFVIIGAVFTVLVIGLIGCVAMLASPDDATSPVAPSPAPKNAGTIAPTQKPNEQAPPTDCQGQEDRNAPCLVHAGKTFVLGSHAVVSGWKVSKNSLDFFEITGKAKNVSDKASTMFITMKFLKGDEVLAAVHCNTTDLEPGQTGTMNCIADGTYTTKYDRITAEAAA